MINPGEIGLNICPLCNGLEEIRIYCPSCQTVMTDEGKLSDFFDDYSPYMDIELLQLVDGFPAGNRERCIHLFRCPACMKEQPVIIGDDF